MLEVLRDVESNVLTEKSEQLLIVYCNLILEKDYTTLDEDSKEELRKTVYAHLMDYCNNYFHNLASTDPTMARRWEFLKQANFEKGLLQDFGDTADISEALAQNYLASLIEYYNQKQQNTNTQN